MSQTVITSAFDALKAQQSVNNNPVILDGFVFANVPGLNITDPIDPAEAMPSAAQIVHRADVAKTGVVNENGVVYSVTLGADIGDFDFNWVGLINKTSNTLAMIVHAPAQQKVKNAAGKQGNVLTRSFLMQYDGAQAQTEITTPAQTWQIDFTARLAGMDERVRVENIDVYGAAAFLGNGFLVTKSGNNYAVTAGAGYVGGLRGSLAADKALTVATKPMKVWADVSWKGTLTSVWQTTVEIQLNAALVDYVKDGIQHYVCAIAQINADGTVTDLRPKGPLSQQQATSDYLRKDKNLADVGDAAQARQHIGLGTAATHDVQTSIDDATAGRLVTNGGAIAVRSTRAASTTGADTADANNLPANAVSFVYSSATNSPGFESTLLDVAGLGGEYNIQIAASYTRSGLVKLRTHNGDTKAWNNWTTVYTTDNKPTSDDVGALASDGTAVAAKKLETARKINTVAFDGSRDISLTPANIGALSASGGEVTGPVKFKNNSAGYPVTLEGGSPTIVFSETDTGKKLYLVMDGVGIRLQEDDTGSGKNAFSWDGATLSTGGGISAISSLEITGAAPIISLGESDTGKKIMMVMDGSSIRLQEDSATGREIWSWSTPQALLATAGSFSAAGEIHAAQRITIRDSDSGLRGISDGVVAFQANGADIGYFSNAGIGLNGGHSFILEARENNPMRVTNEMFNTNGQVMVGGIVSNWYNGWLAFGCQRGGSTDIAGFTVWQNGVQIFNANANGNVNTNTGRLASQTWVGGNYCTIPQRDALSSRISTIETSFVRDSALGAQGSITVTANAASMVPTGCTMTGWYNEGQNPSGDTIYYRPVQKNVNGTWYTVGHSG